jgi:hypothetical protein
VRVLGTRAMSGAQLRYRTKVGIAAGLGYFLTQGGHSQYAIDSAITAALVVGTSVGEDLATSANRVGLDVLSCALTMPRRESCHEIGQRIAHLAGNDAM